jgi:hypothetical protein
MKTLLFNGCSFMAGDAIAWEQYCISKGRPSIDWNVFWSQSHDRPEVNEFVKEYRFDYRRLHNLPMAVATHLSSSRIDISEDGNSNDSIAISTIAFLLSKTWEERKQFHVCIGWSSNSRFLKYIEQINSFGNLHVNHVGGGHGQVELGDIQDYIDIVFSQSTDEDIWLNYVKNIMLLENFLKSNGITYTFYRSLGSDHDARDLKTFPPFDFELPNAHITNHSNWYSFHMNGDLTAYPYEQSSWTSTIIHDESQWISKKNRHPNLKAVAIFSNSLADFIRKQNVLN